ncbi:hypothetical protein F4777DRAFT_263661 [Nemania sp. FL0916]|nr:hypothetical protein F4777DRAFT_263661 [Nemania sp. FL0916]
MGFPAINIMPSNQERNPNGARESEEVRKKKKRVDNWRCSIPAPPSYDLDGSIARLNTRIDELPPYPATRHISPSAAKKDPLPSAAEPDPLPSTVERDPVIPSAAGRDPVPSAAERDLVPSAAERDPLPSAEGRPPLPFVVEQDPIRATDGRHLLPGEERLHLLAFLAARHPPLPEKKRRPSPSEKKRHPSSPEKKQHRSPSKKNRHSSPSKKKRHPLPSQAEKDPLPATNGQHPLPSAEGRQILPTAEGWHPLPTAAERHPSPPEKKRHSSPSTTELYLLPYVAQGHPLLTAAKRHALSTIKGRQEKPVTPDEELQLILEQPFQMGWEETREAVCGLFDEFWRAHQSVFAYWREVEENKVAIYHAVRSVAKLRQDYVNVQWDQIKKQKSTDKQNSTEKLEQGHGGLQQAQKEASQSQGELKRKRDDKDSQEDLRNVEFRQAYLKAQHDILQLEVKGRLIMEIARRTQKEMQLAFWSMHRARERLGEKVGPQITDRLFPRIKNLLRETHNLKMI